MGNATEQDSKARNIEYESGWLKALSVGLSLTMRKLEISDPHSE